MTDDEYYRQATVKLARKQGISAAAFMMGVDTATVETWLSDGGLAAEEPDSCAPSSPANSSDPLTNPTSSVRWEPWRNEALCKSPAEKFTQQTTKDQKAICRRCPVMDPCLADALRNSRTREVAGVWGGTTEHERKKLRQKRRYKPTG